MQQRLLAENIIPFRQGLDVKKQQRPAEKIKRVINPAQMRIELKIVQVAEYRGADTYRDRDCEDCQNSVGGSVTSFYGDQSEGQQQRLCYSQQAQDSGWG